MYKTLSALLLLCTVSISAFASPHHYDITFYDDIGGTNHTIRVADQAWGEFSASSGTINAVQPFHTSYTIDCDDDDFKYFGIYVGIAPIKDQQFVRYLALSELSSEHPNICHILASKVNTFEIKCD